MKKDIDKYFELINEKRDKLIQAQMLNKKKDIKTIREEIDTLMNLCFCDKDENPLTIKE